jgi:hypothetical protein
LAACPFTVVREEGNLVTYEVKLMKQVITLETGKSFGEMAIVKDKPRAAGISCAENSEFATLSKEAYLKTIA